MDREMISKYKIEIKNITERMIQNTYDRGDLLNVVLMCESLLNELEESNRARVSTLKTLSYLSHVSGRG